MFIIGAGVAGLQAIATARRLGGVVSGFDVRPAAREQVLSLGATFVANELVDDSAQTAGGYALSQTDTEQANTLAAIVKHIKDQDLVVTTAQIPGRAAPRLITRDMVASMRAGSVIVDLAAGNGRKLRALQAGRNDAGQRRHHPGAVESAGHGGVPCKSDVRPQHRSRLLKHLIQDGALNLDAADEITGAMMMTHDGKGASLMQHFSNCTCSCWRRSSASW